MEGKSIESLLPGISTSLAQDLDSAMIRVLISSYSDGSGEFTRDADAWNRACEIFSQYGYVLTSMGGEGHKDGLSFAFANIARAGETYRCRSTSFEVNRSP